jgi:hypothetical protein
VLLTIDKSAQVGATAEGELATVAFPSMSAKDVSGGIPKIICEGRFKDKKLTYEPGVAAAFPIGTTPVVCIAYGDSGESPAVKFPVTVCKPGVFFVDGACNGG